MTRLSILLLAAASLAGCDARPSVKRVGILSIASPLRTCVSSLEEGLTEHGRSRDWKLEFVVRDASDDPAALPRLANELVDEGVDIILAPTTSAAVAAKAAADTSGIPVVFTLVSDPVRAGLVASWRNDSGNVTGVVDSGFALAGKRLEILLAIAPEVRTVLVPLTESLPSEAIWEALSVAAGKLNVELVPLRVSSKESLATAYKELEPGAVGAVYIVSDMMIESAQEALAQMVARLRIPVIAGGRDLEGTLISLGDSWEDVCAQSSLLAAKVLSGVPPSDLPLERPRDPKVRLFAGTARDIGFVFPELAWSLAGEIR